MKMPSDSPITLMKKPVTETGFRPGRGPTDKRTDQETDIPISTSINSYFVKKILDFSCKKTGYTTSYKTGYGPFNRRTDGRTTPLIEMRGRI